MKFGANRKYSDGIKEDHRQFEVLVGVAGPTGAGKTSLLNALLGTYELLPSGHEQAATAVSCKASWNFDAQPGKENRAEIYFQTADDIKEEIILTLKAIVTQETIDQIPYDNEDQRTDVRAMAASEVKEGMHKILAVWSVTENEVRDLALKYHDDYDDYTIPAEKIMRSNSAVVELLGGEVKKIYESSPEALGKHIKPYLDSTTAKHGEGEEFAAWPLIRNVDLYLQNEILRTGICLVDLPGTGDNVESRSKVAQDYLEKLEVTMIVAGIHRAVNEQIIQKLMNDYQEMRLRMDSGYNQHSYGVILSKMDEIDFAAYVKASKDAAGDALVEYHREILQDASNKSRDLSVKKKANKKIKKKLKSKIKKIQNILEKQGKKIKRGTSMDLQEELIGAKAELKDSEELSQKLNDEQTALEKACEVSNTHLQYWAVNKRNSVVEDRMQENFRRQQRQFTRSQKRESEDDEGQTENHLDVLSCSSKAYWQIQNDNKPMPAFPTERYTGVPRVVQWIHSATAERREEHLNCILQSYLGSIQGLDSWCKMAKVDVPIALSPKKVENAMKKESDKLLQVSRDRR